MAHSDSAHVFMLAVPGLLLFLVCSFIWIVQKIPAIFVCLWSEIICFSVTTWTWRCLVWWHCLQAVFSYLTKQVYIIHIFLLVWVLICLAWVAIARIFSHSSQLICFSSPPPPPTPNFSFPPSVPSFLSLASSAVCLPDCFEFSWNNYCSHR